jgi:3-isopropylmalate dehydratase small subunit
MAFRCVIAPSFADIFHTNSLKNGLLPVTLSEAEVDGLFYDCAAFPGFRLVVDLAEQTVATENRAKILRFDVDPFRKYCLLNGPGRNRPDAAPRGQDPRVRSAPPGRAALAVPLAR